MPIDNRTFSHKHTCTQESNTRTSIQVYLCVCMKILEGLCQLTEVDGLCYTGPVEARLGRVAGTGLGPSGSYPCRQSARVCPWRRERASERMEHRIPAVTTPSCDHCHVTAPSPRSALSRSLETAACLMLVLSVPKNTPPQPSCGQCQHCAQKVRHDGPDFRPGCTNVVSLL